MLQQSLSNLFLWLCLPFSLIFSLARCLSLFFSFTHKHTHALSLSLSLTHSLSILQVVHVASNTSCIHMNKSCHSHKWVVSHKWLSRFTQMNESCHTNEWVMSHIWMSHVTCMDESCHSNERVVLQTQNVIATRMPRLPMHLCVTCLIHMCAQTQVYVWHDSAVWVTFFILVGVFLVVLQTHAGRRTVFWGP